MFLPSANHQMPGAPIRQSADHNRFSPGYGGGNAGTAQRQRAGQHGSGARSDPMNTDQPRRRQRSNSADRLHVRRGTMPGGPVTATEWSDQIESLQHQIRAIDRTVADHAHVIGQLRTSVNEANTVHSSMAKQIEDLATHTDRRFIDGGEKVRQRLDVLQLEIRALAQSRGAINPPPIPQPPGFAFHNISTPGSPNGRPTEEARGRPHFTESHVQADPFHNARVSDFEGLQRPASARPMPHGEFFGRPSSDSNAAGGRGDFFGLDANAPRPQQHADAYHGRPDRRNDGHPCTQYDGRAGPMTDKPFHVGNGAQDYYGPRGPAPPQGGAHNF